MRFPPHVPGSTADIAIKGAQARKPRPPLTDPGQLTDKERHYLAISSGRRGTHRDNVATAQRTRLIAAGWLREDNARVVLTEPGRRALNTTVPEKLRGEKYEDVLLQVGHGLTTIPARSVQDAGVVIDPAMLDTRHAADAAERLAETWEPKQAARALRDLARQPITLADDIAAMKQRQADATTNDEEEAA